MVSQLKPLTYSQLINNIDQSKSTNGKSKHSFLDLKKLVENFRLNGSFVSKSYYQSIPEFAYNDPPKGPIPAYFECIHCEQQGPGNHLKDCIKPFESSLYLTEDGEEKFKKVAGTSYKLIVKKRGQKKIVSTSVKNQRFSDNVEIVYENSEKKGTIIKIGKNGSINIISANFEGSSQNKSLVDDLFRKINETGALNEDNYGSSVFRVDPQISYTYLILVQFNLYPKEQTNLFVNLKSIDLNLWHTPLFKQRSGSQTFFVLSGQRYQVQNYRYNSGDIVSRSNKTTNPFIQFEIPIEGIFKVGILIYKKGAVQMRLSYLDKNFENKSDYPLGLEILKNVYSFLKRVFEILIETASETNYPIIVSEAEPEKKGILNMVDGTQPKVCHDRKGRELRPVPYSFYGTCPMQGYYVRPEGKLRPDGLYEPCCYKIKTSGQDSKKYIEDLYRNGYKEVKDPDRKSAVFIPGTRTVESRRFNGLNDLTQEELLNFMEKNGYIGKKNTFKNTISPVIQFERFSYTSKPIEDNLMTSIPNSTIRAFLQFDQQGNSIFVNGVYQTAESKLKIVPELNNTIMDGYLDTDEEIFYPFDIILFKNNNITQQPFKKRFETLMYCLDILQENSGSLTLSTNFDDNIENLQEPGTFIIFLPLNSVYTPGVINKNVKILTKQIEPIFITLNVSPFRTNRWKVSFKGKEIPEMLLPQREKVKVEENSIEIPVAFTNKNKVEDRDIILFQINRNTNGLINSNKPLIGIQKIDKHINDYSDIINILEHVKN